MESFLTPEFPPEPLIVDLPNGSKLADRFTIKGRLGRGRWGQVFLAEDSLRAVTVAIKVAVVIPNKPSAVALRYQREVRLYARLTDFTNIIQVYDLYETQWDGVSLWSLSIEYADGGNFRSWLTQRQNDQELRTKQGLKLFQEACRGVIAIHSAGVVNLALKPDNFLLVDGHIKVSDLGWAHLLGENDKYYFRSEAAPSCSREDQAYMSPEHYSLPRSEAPDSRADIYSLGVIAYELLSHDCKPPFTGGKDKIKAGHLYQQAQKLTGVEDSLAEIVARCLEKDPDDRFQSVEELVAALLQNNRTKVPGDKQDNHGAIEHLWEEATSLYSQGKLNSAIPILEAICSKDPGHAKALNMKDDIHRRYIQAEQMYREMDRLADNGNLEQCQLVLSSAIETYPDHPFGVTVQIKVAMNADRYRQCMKTAFDALGKKRLASAKALFEEAFRLKRSAPLVADMLDLINRIQDIRKSLDIAMIQNDRSRVDQLIASEEALEKKLIGYSPRLQIGI